MWNLPDQALNIEEAPVFMVGLGAPMSIEPRMTLVEVVIIVPEAEQTVWLTLHSLHEPSLQDPPEYGYPVCKPAYAVGSDHELVAMTVVGGCDSDPVASINPDGSPPEIEVGGVPRSLTLQKDAQGKQIEFVSLHNEGELSFSGLAYVAGTTPIQFEIDGRYYTNGPVSFQVPVGGTTRITPFYDGGGSVDATIELEVCDELWTIPVGSPNAWKDCAWSVDNLVFGDVGIGQSEVLHVDLTNTGFEPLPVETYYSVHPFYFQKIQHSGNILATGDSCTFRVTFSPTILGAQSRTLTIGSQICSLDLTGTCLDGPPECQVSHSVLNYYDVVVGGNYQSKSFTIRNVGGGTLEGLTTLYDDSGFFGLSSSSVGGFSLANNESKTIRVIFDPLEEGNFSAEIDLGLHCANVSLYGEALVLDPACFVSVSALDFGEVIVGANPPYRYFLIRNTGGGALQGNITLNDATGSFHMWNYSGGSFNLGPNETRSVSVYFDPAEEGTYSAEIDLGLECGSIPLVGYAIDIPPECEINTTSLDYDEFVVGQSPQRMYIRVKNVGGGLMEGSFVLNDTTGAFSIESYSNLSYSLSNNKSHYVYITFDAPAAGHYSANIDLGSTCGSIPLSGNAVELAPECLVSVSELVFDEHIVGGYANTRYLVVQNVGGGLLEGAVTVADSTAGFALRNWNGNAYSLAHMQSKYFGVGFSPEAAGEYSTLVELGSDCGSIPVSGSAIELAPQCSLIGSHLENGVLEIFPVPVGGSHTGYLGIKNTGGGYLTGQVTLEPSGGAFQVVGSGHYSLHNEESTYLQIKFTPLEVGPASSVVHTGSICGDLMVTSEGQESYADCRSYLHHTHFERVAVGDTARGYIYLYNSGYLELEGDLQVDGEGFQLENPGPLTLAVGEYRYEELWFIPETVGDFSAVISTGLALCPGDWEIQGGSVPAGSDRMGFYFDAEGTRSTLDTDHPKVMETAYLVLHNPSAEGQLTQWYVNFWASGSTMVMDDWNSHQPGDLRGNSYYRRMFLDSPIPHSETTVLADFSVMITDPDEASGVEVGYAYYQTLTSSGLETLAVREPAGLLINGSKSDFKKLPATPIANLSEDGVALEWPCGPKNFEGFHVYRRVDNETPRRLTDEPVVFTEHEGRYEDTNLPEDAFEVHYFVTSLFKGVESQPGAEVTLVLDPQESEIPVPTQTRLLAIYLNPFNPETKISFEIASPDRVQIKIYNVGGRLVRNLTDQHFDSGYFEETWNGRDDAGRSLPSNVYYARMVSGSVVQMRKMTLLK